MTPQQQAEEDVWFTDPAKLDGGVIVMALMVIREARFHRTSTQLTFLRDRNVSAEMLSDRIGALMTELALRMPAREAR